MATKLNIPIKQSGSTLSANEFNAVVVAINENADSLDSTYEEINKKLGKTTIVIDSNTSVTINTIEDLIEYLHKYGTSTPTYNMPPLIKINQSTYVYKKGQDLKFDIELYDSEGGFLTLVGENPSISGGYSSFIIENLRSGINTIDLNQLVYNNTTSKLDVGTYIFSNIYVIDGLGRSSVSPVNIKIIIGSIELVSSFDSTISYEKNKAISVRYGVSSIVNEMKLTYTITGKMLIENEAGEFEYLSYSETSEVNDSFKATSNDEDFSTGTFYYHNYILPEPFTNVGDYNLTIIAEGKGDGIGQTSNILNINIVVNEPGVLYSSSNFDANGLYYAGDSLIIPVNIFYSQIDGVSYMYQCEAWIEGLDITGQSAITSSTKGIELKLTLPDDADLYTIKYKTNIIAPTDEVYKTNINYVVLQARSKSAYQVINDSSSKLELYLTAKGKSNSQPNWLTWNNRYNLDQKYFGSLYNFASVVNGWEDKSEASQHIGDALFCSGDAYVIVNYLPFDKYDDNKYGLTLDFSIREGDLLSENNYNLSIGRPESYPQKGVYLKNNYLHIWGLNSNIKIPIICDDKVLTKLGEWETGDEYAHITITFNYTTKEVFVYINGIISSYGTYSDPGSITHDNPIVINGYIASNGLIAGKSDTKIRFFRVYKSCLNEEQVLSNYIASYPDDIERSLLESLNDTVTPILSTAYLRGDRAGMLKDEMRRLFFSFNSGNESIVADTYIPDPQAVGQYSQAYMDMKKEFPGDFDLQGNSSLSYPVKNYGIDIFDGEAWDVSKSINSKEYNMVFNEDKVVQYRPWPNWDSYHLKANYIDSSHCNNLIMAKLSEIVFRLPYNWTESNAYIESFPSLNSNVQPFKNFTVTRPSNVTDPYSRFPVYPMRVAVDGFPFVLKGDYTDSNGKNFEKEFIGLYTWNMKQHRKLYSMPKPSGDLNRRYFIYRCESNGDSVHEQLRSGYCKFKDMSKEILLLDSYGRNLSLTYIESQENNEMFAKYNQFDYNWFPIESELGYLQPNGLYTWIKFSSSKDDTNLSNSYTGKVYIGISYDNNSNIKSNNPIDYKWINIDIVEGIEKDNGEYILIRYGSSDIGEDMTLSPTGMSYIGIKYNGVKTKWVEGVDYFNKTLDPEELEWRPGAELIMDWECREPDDVGVGHWEEQVNGEWIRTENIINPKDLDKNSLLPDKILRFVWDKLNPDGTADRKGNDLMDYWPSIVDESIQIPTLSNPNQTFSAINKQKAKLAKQQHVDFLNAISWMSNASDEAFSDPKIFEKYFDLRNCLDYILCCLTFCLTDSIGRNLTMIAYDQESTLSSGGVMDRKPMRFYPVFYDIDTAFGTNVQGGLYSTPYIEWPYDITGLYTAKEGAGQEYNCFGTLFLKRISKCYPKALARRYQELRSGTVDPLDSKTKLPAPFDYLSILQMYTKQMVGRIGERYFNEDAIYKYIGFENDPDAVAKRNYITNARGNKVMFMKSFLKKRMDYIDSLMGYIPDTEDMAYFQHYSRGQLTLTIETLVAGYIRISFAQNQSISVYVDGKNPTTVSYNYSDVTQHILRIYNCGIITKLNGLQNKDVRIARLNSMTNLQILDLKGNPNFGMEVSTLEISECKGLKTIDLTGCNGSNVFTPDLSGCVLLEEFLVSNSSVGNCSFSTNLNIKTINISNCPNFTSLSVNGLYKLNNLIYDEYRLVSLDISNSGIIIDFSQDNTYNNLLSLTIVANTNISELRFGSNSFNSLQQLNISNCSKLTSVIDLFKNRAGYPNLNRNFLANCTSLTTVEGLFENSILTTLPNQMFFNSNKIQSLKRCFKNCNYLMTIPSGILDSMPELVDITEIFYGSKLQRYEDIIELDENGTEQVVGKKVLNVFQTDNLFYNCPKLRIATSAFENSELINVPINLFANSTLINTIDYCFKGIQNPLSEYDGERKTLIVPDNLFVSLPYVNSINEAFMNTFMGNINDNIFSSVPKIINANNLFNGSSLGRIPINIFQNAPLLESLEGTFASYNLSEIPENFLNNVPKLNNVLNIFKNSKITNLPIGFLYNNNITKFKFSDLGMPGLLAVNSDILGCNKLIDITNLFSNVAIESVPNNLFSTNSNISICLNLFTDSNIKSIGDNFLLNNSITTINSLAIGNVLLESIGNGFMKNSPFLANADYSFQNSSISYIGNEFMKNCQNLTSCISMFRNSTLQEFGYEFMRNVPKLAYITNMFNGSLISSISTNSFVYTGLTTFRFSNFCSNKLSLDQSFLSETSTIVNINNMFTNSLIEYIPNNFFNGHTIDNPSNIFYASYIKSIGDNCFNNIQKSDCSTLFDGCPIESIGNNFIINSKVQNMSGMFEDNRTIKTIGSNFLGDKLLLVNASALFKGSTIQSFESGFLSNCPSLVNITDIFNTTNISSIPNGFISNSPLVNSLIGVFSNNLIESIPDNFANNNHGISSLTGVFDESIVHTIGENFMSGSTGIENITNMFYQNQNIKNIGKLFLSNSSITSSDYAFYGSSIVNIGSGILNNTNLNSAISMFENCTSLKKIGEYIEWYNPEKESQYTYKKYADLTKCNTNGQQAEISLYCSNPYLEEEYQSFTGVSSLSNMANIFKNTGLIRTPKGFLKNITGISSPILSTVLSGSSIKFINGDMFSGSVVTNVNSMFDNTSIIAIPKGFLSNQPNGTFIEMNWYNKSSYQQIKYISSDFGKGSTFSTPSSGSYIYNPFMNSNVSLIQNDWCNWLNSWRTWRGAPYYSYSYEFMGGLLMGANIINIPRNFLKEFVGELESSYGASAGEAEFVLSSKLDTIIPEGYLSKCRSYTGGLLPQQFYNGSLKGVIPKTFLKSCGSVYFRRFFENQYNLSGIEDGFLSHEFTARSIPYGATYYSTERIFAGTKFKNIPDSFLSNANGISTSSLAYILYNSELTSPPYFFNRISNCVSLEQAFYGTKFTNSDGSWDDVLLTFTSNNDLLANAWNLFSNSKITKVPDNFMYNCPNLADARSMFYGSQLTSLPLNMLSTGTNNGCNISGLFGYCGSLTGTIPNGFLKNVKATSIADVFSNTKLTGLIPSDLLEGCSGYVTNCFGAFNGSLFNWFVNNTWNVSDFSKVTTFERMFMSSNISKIPNTFCNKNFNVLTNAASMFQSSKVQSVPDGFLSNCPILTNAASMFRDCIYINSIGLNVLYNCPNINNAHSILYRTTSLNELLKESFLYNSTKMVTLGEFARESGLTGIEANNVFYRLNASVSNKNFDRSFQKCLSFIGSAPQLWNLYGSTTSSHLYTFAESINISNYSSIPSSWK